MKNTEWVLSEPEPSPLQQKASENIPESYEGMAGSLLTKTFMHFQVVSLVRLSLPCFSSYII